MPLTAAETPGGWSGCRQAAADMVSEEKRGAGECDCFRIPLSFCYLLVSIAASAIATVDLLEHGFIVTACHFSKERGL